MARVAHIGPENANTRVRASASAIKATLTAIRDSGLTVDKVCIVGGKIEISFNSVEGEDGDGKDGGLEQW